MIFAFVSMEYQELGFPLKNENALVILNEDNQPSHVAHKGVFKQLGTWFLQGLQSERRKEIINSPEYAKLLSDPKFKDLQFRPDAQAKIISESQHKHNDLQLNYDSWQISTSSSEDVELYNPISVSPFENPQQKLVFADITIYAHDLWKSNPNYASKMPVRNKSSLVCINAETEILFVAQAYKFRKVSPQELVVHKLPQTKDKIAYKTNSFTKNIEFDHLNWSWEKSTDNI